MIIEKQNFLLGLNDGQYEAVMCTEGPLLVLAGAGTGKTKVLTSRIANIILHNLAKPEEILAVTFTNKAAKEMHHRINMMVDTYGLNIGTFHSIAAKLLRLHINLLSNNIEKNFTIIDEDDQLKLVKDILIRENIDIKSYPPKVIKSIISRWKDLSLLPNKLSSADLIFPLQRYAATVYGIYQDQLAKNNSVDFGDLLLYNNELFKHHPTLLEHYQNKYKYILIDEYQDTNVAQYLWSRMLASKRKNICCVGDDDQSIYSWRGAEIGNILRFEKDFPNSKIIKLEQNYRSTNEILHAASHIIGHNKHRHYKKLWTTQQIGEKIKIVPCYNDKEEARFIVSEVEKLIKNNKFQINQIAILVRASFQTRALEEILINNALPYKIIGGFRFYERAEIKDVLAYITIILNSSNGLALERIINTPRRSVGNITLKKIREYSFANDLSILASIKELILNKEFKGKLLQELEIFIKQLEEWQRNYQLLPPSEATIIMLEESGYLNMLKMEATDEAKGRIENINELLKAINEFNDIKEFLEHASLVMDNDSLSATFGGAVNIMTLHASKGLEFDVVFLPGWEEGLFPNQRSLIEEGGKGVEEERRIAYVGITRAKKELYITYAANRWMFNEVISSQPSRFVAELPPEICIILNNNKNFLYSNANYNVNYKSNNYNSKNISVNKESNILSPGKRVAHEKFGLGIIIKIDNDNLEIIFDSDKSIKKVKKSFIKLA